MGETGPGNDGISALHPGARGESKELLLNEADSDAEVWRVKGFLEKRPFERDFESSKFSSNTSRAPPPQNTYM